MFNLCINKSFLLQQTCISSKNQAITNRKRTKGMHRINNKTPSMKKLAKKNMWVDPYKGESIETDDEEQSFF